MQSRGIVTTQLDVTLTFSAAGIAGHDSNFIELAISADIRDFVIIIHCGVFFSSHNKRMIVSNAHSRMGGQTVREVLPAQTGWVLCWED